MRGLCVLGAIVFAVSCSVDAPDYAGVAFQCSVEQPCQDGMQCVVGQCSLGGDAAVEIDADSDAMGVECLPTVGPEDAFDGPAIDAKWTVSKNMGTNAEIVSGSLVLTPTTSNPQRFVMLSSEPFDFDERRAFIEITKMVDVTKKTIAQLRARLDSGNFYYISQQEGTLTFAVVVSNNNSFTLETAAYDPVAHRFWQLRKQAGRMYADTSEDGKTWVSLGSTTTADIVGDLRLDIRVGTETNISAPGAMHITNVNSGNGLCP